MVYVAQTEPIRVRTGNIARPAITDWFLPV
jgi:hypothetical protein